MQDAPAVDTVRHGGCLCGAVRYTVRGEPAMTGVCYCTSCRRLSGAGHAFQAAVPADALTITGSVRDYAWQADSGNRITTSFCPACGCPLFGRSAGMPGLAMFRVASLDEPATLTPQMAIFASRRLAWDHVDPSLPAFATMPPMGGPPTAAA